MAVRFVCFRTNSILEPPRDLLPSGWYMISSIMFERFSRGYYVGRLSIEPTPHEESGALIQRITHERLNEQLYSTGEGIEPLDLPLVMKLETSHFAVHGDEGVPENTLWLPESVLADSRIDAPPALCEVFLAKADRAAQLLRLAGRAV